MDKLFEKNKNWISTSQASERKLVKVKMPLVRTGADHGSSLPCQCFGIGRVIACSAQAGEGEAVSKFYAYCVEVGVPGIAPRPLAEQTRMLRELGYDGTGFALDAKLESNLKILDDARIQLYMAWTSVNVNSTKGAAYSPQLPDAIRNSRVGR